MYKVLIAPLGEVYEHLTLAQAHSVASQASVCSDVRKVTVLPMGNNVVMFPKTK